VLGRLTVLCKRFDDAAATQAIDAYVYHKTNPLQLRTVPVVPIAHSMVALDQLGTLAEELKGVLVATVDQITHEAITDYVRASLRWRPFHYSKFRFRLAV